uniref:Uncharacterized protein n=1 Tax=Arundo donax TaxID=35708 RepID=A0A0A9BCN3_ARUDO
MQMGGNHCLMCVQMYFLLISLYFFVLMTSHAYIERTVNTLLFSDACL